MAKPSRSECARLRLWRNEPATWQRPIAPSIERVIAKYGPIPSLDGITAERLAARLGADKKTIQGKIHFVLPVRIGEVRVASGIDHRLVLESIEAALA